MKTRTVKIREESYKLLVEYAGELQKELREPVSIDKALNFFFRKSKLSALAGMWQMTDSEAADMMKSLRKGWGKWKIGFA